MNNPIILKFLQEFINRLGKKNPLFFNILSWLATAATVITGLPEFLQWWGITLPSWATVLENKFVAIASLVTILVSNLTVKTDSIPENKMQKVLPLTSNEK